MAKADDVSLLERHVEKLVLGVCLILLGLAANHWIASSPVSLSVIGTSGRGTQKEIAPEQVDNVLQRAAGSVKKMYNNAPGSVPPPPRWAGNTVELRNIAPARREVMDVAMPQRPIRVETGPGRVATAKPTLAQLQALMPAPPKPVMVVHAELPRTGSDELTDALVARGAVVYPVVELAEAWQERLKDTSITSPKVIVRQVIVQVQEDLGGEQWSPPKTVTLAARPGADGNDVAIPEIPDLQAGNVQAVREARDLLGKESWQRQVLQPEYYKIWSAARGGWSDWRAHAPALKPAQGQVKAWFHDQATMKLGRTYRYRVQMAFVNPLLTYENDVDSKHIEDARTKYVPTGFSEWSEPVSRQRQVRFFVSGASRTTHQITVTIFAQKWGQWVMKSFRVLTGQPIGGKANVVMPDPLGQAGGQRSVEVDFSTGAVALRFNFNKTMLRRGIKVRTAEMLYLDAKGALRARVQARDDSSELRKNLLEEVKQAMAEG